MNLLGDPREPPELRALGTTDAAIEARCGADFVLLGRSGTLALAMQRKTVPDLLASLGDGGQGWRPGRGSAASCAAWKCGARSTSPTLR